MKSDCRQGQVPWNVSKWEEGVLVSSPDMRGSHRRVYTFRWKYLVHIFKKSSNTTQYCLTALFLFLSTMEVVRDYNIEKNI